VPSDIDLDHSGRASQGKYHYLKSSQMGSPVDKGTISDHWFVSVETPRHWRIGSKRGHARQTITFPTESEAKQFAKAMLSDGMKMMAGTLHPHQPMRRIIGSYEINRWIEEQESNDPA
jgi:hypothetical protein